MCKRPSCVSRKNEYNRIEANRNTSQHRRLKSAARRNYPREDRQPEPVPPELAFRRASHRVADELLDLEKENLKGVEGDALVELPAGGRFICEGRQETGRRVGAMSDWRPGLRPLCYGALGPDVYGARLGTVQQRPEIHRLRATMVHAGDPAGRRSSGRGRPVNALAAPPPRSPAEKRA